MPDDMVPPQAADGVSSGLLVQILNAAHVARCSDLHFRVGKPPYGRAQGRLFAMDGAALTEADIRGIIKTSAKRALPDELDSGAFEYSFEQTGVSRFRGHAFLENGKWALALRTVPLNVPGFNELRLPPVVKRFCEMSSGLVLISGPTGSGKSTTAAAMLDHIVRTELIHLVSIEDPIEYRVDHGQSCVSQREVGSDVPTFVQGIRAAMREDPDIIFVGEVRDRDSLEAVLNAGETGHSVISTYHTQTAAHTIRRIVGSFPNDEQQSIRDRLADCLRGIIAQRLVPLANGQGRVLCSEVMVNNYSVKECIRDPVKLKGLTQLIEKSNAENMHSFDQSLANLVRSRLVDPKVALANATSPNNLRRSFNGAY
ncbi:MAG: PilT/PilU family type 4a pilus ATPase [Deltaproteobacteria bacterium]|nr:PilT/PilU family type 4a pilus ATPase [Deltaproteobacteria bacterium]